MGIIDVRNATFSYGRENVFENIDLELNAGEVFCLFGPNGCGKSTLILCMLGVLPLSNGQISLGNRNVRGMKPSEVAKVAAYIPQSHEKPFPYKAIDVVLMARTAHTATFSPPSPADRKIAEESWHRRVQRQAIHPTERRRNTTGSCGKSARPANPYSDNGRADSPSRFPQRT
jgi:iron complex transport system ATP-binding protein